MAQRLFLTLTQNDGPWKQPSPAQIRGQFGGASQELIRIFPRPPGSTRILSSPQRREDSPLSCLCEPSCLCVFVVRFFFVAAPLRCGPFCSARLVRGRDAEIAAHLDFSIV